MTPEQIELVQRAWGRVTALNNTYVQEVYTELFRLSPDLINLFPDPAGMPVTKVSETLNTVITMQSHQFGLLKQALTLVLARRLGEHFTPALSDAWSQMYDEIAALMLEGLGQHTPSVV